MFRLCVLIDAVMFCPLTRCLSLAQYAVTSSRVFFAVPCWEGGGEEEEGLRPLELMLHS